MLSDYCFTVTYKIIGVSALSDFHQSYTLGVETEDAVSSLVKNGVIGFQGPSNLPKIVGDDTFLGWRVAECNYELEDPGVILTHNTHIGFIVGNETSASISVSLAPAFAPTMSFDLEWESFDDEAGETDYKVMTVIVDQSVIDPEAACTYADDATSMTAGSDAWDEWFGYYPVVLDNGVEYKRLNPNNLQQYVDGTAIGTLTGTQDAMIARPLMGWRIVSEGTKVYISMTNNPNAEGFVYHAHYNGSKYVDKFYEGIYLSSIYNSNSVNSHSGQTPVTDISFADVIDNLPQIRPTGYQMIGYYQRLFWQIQYLLKYKNTDSQAVVGQDITIEDLDDAPSNSDAATWPTTTGMADARGMNWGEQTACYSAKCLGIENPWGNLGSWVGGLLCDSSGNLRTCKDPTKFSYDFTDANYITVGKIKDPDGYTYGTIKTIYGDSELGFAPSLCDDSFESDVSPFAVDCAFVYPGRVPIVGGFPGSDLGAWCGAFVLVVEVAPAVSPGRVGFRLMYV